MRLRTLSVAEELNQPQIADAATGTSIPAENSNADSQLATSTIVDVQADGSATTGTAAARAREQRYQELLRSAPPGAPSGTPSPATPAPRPPPQAPPSLVDRIVKPIANALNPSRSKPAPQAMASQPRPTPPDQPSGGDTTTADPQGERDADSDVAPPRLLAAEFTPPQVQDGEITSFAATVTDDLAGVRGVSGVVVSPSGAQQGFACQREGDVRFVARITVPREAAEGVWTVKYLTLSDNAGNTANLNASTGQLPPSASFRVASSASDSKAPTLNRVWLDQASMGAGEKNTVFVQAEDDKSGVQLISGVFVSPNKQARIGFGCRAADGGIWSCPITPPSCVDCGAWQLEQLQLQDKANNMATIRADVEAIAQVRLNLFGKDCDSAPPTLTALSLEPPVVSNADGGIIRITAVATDNQCGVASLSGQAMPPSGAGARIFFPFRPTSDGQTFTGEIQVPKHAASGVWTIGWIQALDKGHNMKAYSGSDPVLARVTFRVE